MVNTRSTQKNMVANEVKRNNDLVRIKRDYATTEEEAEDPQEEEEKKEEKEEKEEEEEEEKEEEAERKETKNHLKCDIDFDDAHSEWMKNKKIVNGLYVYTCGKETKSGKTCKRVCSDMNGFYSGCSIHYGWEEEGCKYI